EGGPNPQDQIVGPLLAQDRSQQDRRGQQQNGQPAHQGHTGADLPLISRAVHNGNSTERATGSIHPLWQIWVISDEKAKNNEKAQAPLGSWLAWAFSFSMNANGIQPASLVCENPMVGSHRHCFTKETECRY